MTKEEFIEQAKKEMRELKMIDGHSLAQSAYGDNMRIIENKVVELLTHFEQVIREEERKECHNCLNAINQISDHFEEMTDILKSGKSPIGDKENV